MDIGLLGLGRDSLLFHDVAAVAGAALLEPLLTAFPLKHPRRLRAASVLRREISSARTATAGTIQFSVVGQGPKLAAIMCLPARVGEGVDRRG